MQDNEVEVTFTIASASSGLRCQMNISTTSDLEADWRGVPFVTPYCEGQQCKAYASISLLPCSAYQLCIWCETVVDLGPKMDPSLPSRLDPLHFSIVENFPKMNHFGLRLISDWSPIYKQTDPCAHPGLAQNL